MEQSRGIFCFKDRGSTIRRAEGAFYAYHGSNLHRHYHAVFPWTGNNDLHIVDSGIPVVARIINFETGETVSSYQFDSESGEWSRIATIIDER
jgi:hypothetical protein